MSEGGDTTIIRLPVYQSHKKVWALKIKAIVLRPDSLGGGADLVPEDGYPHFFVPPEYLAKHEPKVGGYFVVYADGYLSFSPAEAFEDGYTRIN